MMDKLYYGYRLGEWTSILSEYWDESKAKLAHDNHTMYAVQYGTKEKPIWYILMDHDGGYVQFFDEYSNVRMSYSFAKLKDGTVFRKYTIVRNYGNAKNELISGVENFYDRKKLTCTVIYYDDGNGFETSRKEVKFNLEDNILPFPAFGHYEKLVDPNIKVYL